MKKLSEKPLVVRTIVGCAIGALTGAIVGWFTFGIADNPEECHPGNDLCALGSLFIAFYVGAAVANFVAAFCIGRHAVKVVVPIWFFLNLFWLYNEHEEVEAYLIILAISIFPALLGGYLGRVVIRSKT